MVLSSDKLRRFAKNVKQKILLADVVKGYLSLERRGNRLVGLCPFHREKTPSFYVFSDHYYCFGCQENGDVYTFIQKKERIGFIESLKFLGQKFNIDTSALHSYQNTDPREQYQRKRYFEILQCAWQFFKTQLFEDSVPYNSLKERKFDKNFIKLIGFGYATEKYEQLSRYLTRQGFQDQEMISASLVSRSSNNGKIFDFFRYRIMIPIFDHQSRLVGFGGRSLEIDPRIKYLNSRESDLFQKSHLLFGFHKARDSIQKKRSVIIVEGYMDVLQLWNHHFLNCVGCLGTALNSRHLEAVKNIADCVYLVFDGDRAGEQASLISIKVAILFPDLDFRVVRLPSGEDPDSYIRKVSYEKFLLLIEDAESLYDFVIKDCLSNTSTSSYGSIMQKTIIPWLRSISDDFHRSILVSKVSEYTAIDRSLIEKSLGYTSPRKSIQKIYLNSSKPAYLSQTQFELIGHLFYLNPEEEGWEAWKEDILALLGADSLGRLFSKKIFKLLEKKDMSSKKTLDYWSQYFPQKFIDIIETLKKEKKLFEKNNNLKNIIKIIQLSNKNNIEKRLKLLKMELARTKNEETLSNKILEEILKTQQHLKRIQLDIKGE